MRVPLGALYYGAGMTRRLTLTISILTVVIFAGAPSLYYAAAAMLRAIHTHTHNELPSIHTLPAPNLPA